MTYRLKAICLASVSLFALAALARPAQCQDDAAIAAVRKSAEDVAKAFNAGKADDVAGMFLAKGELVDEEGTVYQGQQEIKDLLGGFFKRFPGAKLTINIESIRPMGAVALEEGTRIMTTTDGKAQFRYIAVWAKGDRGWQLASFRDFNDDPAPTPHELLQPVAWLVGDWINEGVDGKVAISYRWSADKNFLLGEFEFTSPEAPPRKSSQRIGWDAAAGKIRSWLFESDGGFAEGYWTVVDDGAVIKSSTINPDGTTASATMNITTKDKDRYVIEGTDRIVGDSLEDDFEITVTRRPPTSNN